MGTSGFDDHKTIDSSLLSLPASPIPATDVWPDAPARPRQRVTASVSCRQEGAGVFLVYATRPPHNSQQDFAAGRRVEVSRGKRGARPSDWGEGSEKEPSLPPTPRSPAAHRIVA